MSLSYVRHQRLEQLTPRPRLPRNEIQAYQVLAESAVRQTPTTRPRRSSCGGRTRPQTIAGFSYPDLDAARGIGLAIIVGIVMWAAIWATFYFVIVG